MPIVFVHGIGNHDWSRYQSAARLRDGYFKKFFKPAGGGEISVHNPWWGGNGTSARWKNASFPARGMTKLAVGNAAPDWEFWDQVRAIRIPDSGDDDALLAIARKNLPNAVDLLFSAVNPGELDEQEGDVELLVDLAAQLAELCAKHKTLGSLGEDPDRHADLLSVLAAAAQTPAPGADGTVSLGIKDRGAALKKRAAHAVALLAGGAERLRTELVHQPTAATAAAIRTSAGKRTAGFLGDVMTYTTQRGKTPDDAGQTIETVLSAIRAAAEQASPHDPLIVVAHSLGGEIVYDIASFFQPRIEIDTLVTVGSQVGLFAELGLLPGVPRELPTPAQARVCRIPAVKTWINVIDKSDVLSFRANPIFEGAEDYRYKTGAPWAHSAYFKQPLFYRRLARKLANSS